MIPTRDGGPLCLPSRVARLPDSSAGTRRDNACPAFVRRTVMPLESVQVTTGGRAGSDETDVAVRRERRVATPIEANLPVVPQKGPLTDA